MSPLCVNISAQRGASVTSIMFFVIALAVALKLFVAIVPAQIGDYQLSKILSAQLAEANNSKQTAKQFTERVNKQLAINANYEAKAEELFVFTNKKPGQLAIKKQYSKTNKFFGNIDIVTRFEGDITPKGQTE
ncbi:DUF4845 domain-containing protein [Psychrobacter ciconiae]|uniref:DUF4845 domain-containing protein n=1 Tax=Psychrobacter ciconiae TaxID=1553449 RepID=UPI00191AC6BB|nr:DUF4845 domain-containing protein [Psychrobacter ciconiae]